MHDIYGEAVNFLLTQIFLHFTRVQQLQGNNEQTVESLASDLQSLSMPAEQPPPVPGATLTNDQILNAFRNQQQSKQNCLNIY